MHKKFLLNISIIVIILTITSCSQKMNLELTNGSGDDQKQLLDPVEIYRQEQLLQFGYWIYEMPYLLSYGSETNPPYVFNIIQVYGIEDAMLQLRINSELKEHLKSLEGRLHEPEDIVAYPPQVYLQSDQYLSVGYEFEYFSGKISSRVGNSYFTVDMHTGKTVYLDDLINLNNDFFHLIQTGGILKAEVPFRSLSIEDSTQILNDEFSKKSIDDIYADFRIYKRGEYLNFDENKADRYFMSRYFFYIKNGSIVFYLGGGELVNIALEEIEPFLKVKKW